MSWRDHARPIIAKVLTDTAGQDETAIKAALFEAYPFGPRANHPYKIWLSEIKRQRATAACKPLPLWPEDSLARGQQ